MIDAGAINNNDYERFVKCICWRVMVMAYLDECCVGGQQRLRRGKRFGTLLGKDNAAYARGEPGIAVPGAQWMTDRHIVLVAVDNHGLEAIPFADPDLLYEAHQHLLMRYGCYIIENIDTSALARDHVYECCFIMTRYDRSPRRARPLI